MTQEAPKGAISSAARVKSPSKLHIRMARNPPIPGMSRANAFGNDAGLFIACGHLFLFIYSHGIMSGVI